MTASDFDDLPVEARLQWIYFEGEFVMDIRYYEYKINLYQVKNFYIEVFYHHKKDQIVKIRTLDHTCSRMKFYADQVKLEQVA